MKYHTDFKPACKCGAELKRLSTNVYPNFTTIYYNCKQCGVRHSLKMKKDGTVVEHREIGVRDHPHRTAHRQIKSNQTLCWDCKNAIGGGCSWFTDFTPVAGWKAKKERLYAGCSYTVVDCPQFEEGRARRLDRGAKK